MEAPARYDTVNRDWRNIGGGAFPPETMTAKEYSSSECVTLWLTNAPPLLTFIVLALGGVSAEVFNENLNLLACTRKSCRFIPRNPAAADTNQGHLQCCLQSKV